MNLVMFSTSFDWGTTNNGVACDSIKCSIPDKSVTGACPCGVFGHNSWGKSLKTSFIALSNHQTTASESEPESLAICNTFSGKLGVILIGSAGCSRTGISAT